MTEIMWPSRTTALTSLNESLVSSYCIELVENDLKSKFDNIKCVSFFKKVADHIDEPYSFKDHYINSKEYSLVNKIDIVGFFDIYLTEYKNVEEIFEYVDKRYGWCFNSIYIDGNWFGFDIKTKRYMCYKSINYGNLNMWLDDYLNNTKKINDVFLRVEAKFLYPIKIDHSIYHLTDILTASKIQRRGLEPRSVGKYPNRVYFADDPSICEYLFPNRYGDQTVILKLNFDDYGEEIKRKYIFYPDPEQDFAYFTDSNIDPKYLQVSYGDDFVDIKDIDFEKFLVDIREDRKNKALSEKKRK